MEGVAIQEGNTDYSRILCLTPDFQASMNVDHGTLLIVTRLQCIMSFVFDFKWPSRISVLGETNKMNLTTLIIW